MVHELGYNHHLFPSLSLIHSLPSILTRFAHLDSDKNQGSEEERKKAEAIFKDVGEAYAVLSDEEKRRRYDSGADLDDAGGFGGMGGVDVNEVFQMFFGGGGMGGMGGHGGGGHRHFHFG